MYIDIAKETVAEYIERFLESESLKEALLKTVFSQTANDNLENVLLKVLLLNSLYSTRLLNNEVLSDKRSNADIISMAKHIVANEIFNQWLYSENENENMRAIEYIAYDSSVWLDRAKTNNALSFASKYCSWHFPERYPIYDRYSKGMLYKISQHNTLDLPEVRQKSLNDYKTFCDTFYALKEKLSYRDGINYSSKELDMYLWKYGKEKGIALD